MERREWMKKTGQFLLASSAFAVPAVALSQGPRRGRGRRGGMRFMRDLDLTDDQREQMRALADANRDQMEASGARLHETRKALNDAVEEGADEFTIRSLADELANAEGDAAVMRADQMRQFKELLSPEQLETMQQKKQERDARREERRERFRMRREERRGSGSRGKDL